MARRQLRATHCLLAMILIGFALFLWSGVNFQPSSREADSLRAKDSIVSRDDFLDGDGHLKNTHHLEKRVTIASASDDDYKVAAEKGQLLICYMKKPSEAGGLGTSKWDAYDSLQNWGWSVTTTTNYLGESAPGLKDLVGETGPSDKTVRVHHDKNVLPAAQADPAYQSYKFSYDNNYYPDKGVIVAEWNWRPQASIQDERTSKGNDWNSAMDRKPDLFQLSDAWWLVWKELTSANQRKNLKYIVQHNVVSIPTQQVLARVLRTHWPNEDLPKQGVAPTWDDKKVITPDMNIFAALLGTQSLWGIPWMLIQHHGSDQLTQLEVKSMTATTQTIASNYYQPNLILELGPVSDAE